MATRAGKEQWALWRSRLRDAREAVGVTREELASYMRVHPGSLGMWENGHRVPNSDELLSWIAGLDGSVELVLHGPTMAERRLAEAAMTLPRIPAGGVRRRAAKRGDV